MSHSRKKAPSSQSNNSDAVVGTTLFLLVTMGSSVQLETHKLQTRMQQNDDRSNKKEAQKGQVLHQNHEIKRQIKQSARDHHHHDNHHASNKRSFKR